MLTTASTAKEPHKLTRAISGNSRKKTLAIPTAKIAFAKSAKNLATNSSLSSPMGSTPVV